MPPELINLLPEDRTRLFRRRYFIRLSLAAVVLLILLTGSHALLLVPTHQLLSLQITEHQAELARILSTQGHDDEAVFEAELAALKQSAARIQGIASTRPVTSLLVDMLAIPHTDISLSGFSYTPPAGAKTSSSMSIIGVARTRDDLRRYQLALQTSPLVAAADLPVETYSKSTDIAFTISVTLTTP